jgi:hypothetical protein
MCLQLASVRGKPSNYDEGTLGVTQGYLLLTLDYNVSLALRERATLPMKHNSSGEPMYVIAGQLELLKYACIELLV